MDDSVEDIAAHLMHSREPAKIGKRGHFDSSFLVVMELIMNITKFSSQKKSDSPETSKDDFWSRQLHQPFSQNSEYALRCNF